MYITRYVFIFSRYFTLFLTLFYLSTTMLFVILLAMPSINQNVKKNRDMMP